MRHLFDHHRDAEGLFLRKLESEEKRIRVMALTAIAVIVVFALAYFRFPFF